MGKAERWGGDPKGGRYCTIALESGDTIVVNHEKGAFMGGWLTIVAGR